MDDVSLLIPASVSLAGEDWTVPVVSTQCFRSGNLSECFQQTKSWVHVTVNLIENVYDC